MKSYVEAMYPMWPSLWLTPQSCRLLNGFVDAGHSCVQKFTEMAVLQTVLHSSSHYFHGLASLVLTICI